MTVPDREELLKLRAIVEADQQVLADMDRTIGAMYVRRGEVLDRFQANQSRLRSLEAAFYANFAAEAAVAKAAQQ